MIPEKAKLSMLFLIKICSTTRLTGLSPEIISNVAGTTRDFCFTMATVKRLVVELSASVVCDTLSLYKPRFNMAKLEE